MGEVTTIGIELAKNSSGLAPVNAAGAIVVAEAVRGWRPGGTAGQDVLLSDRTGHCRRGLLSLAS
jgi:hypothetical protein